jgi:hypothetical protein
MKGLGLDLLKVDLKKVSPRYKRPICAIRNIDKKFFGNYQLIRKHFGISSFVRDSHKLPFGAFTGFDFDELCKIMYSSCMDDESIGRFFQKHYQYRVIEKIWSSMHQWGRNAEGAWNEIVDTYECIRHFNFGNHEDFEIRLDHTTGHNRNGLSKHTRTCLDGVFAFLVYYKSKHAMTIGFSFMKGKIILLQQVQVVRGKTSFLSNIPDNRIEFAIKLFKENFPEHQLYLVDGKNLIENILAEYRNGLSEIIETRNRYRESASKSTKRKDVKFFKEQAEEYELARILQEAKISHLENDANRLESLYSDAGKYALNRSVHIREHNLSHYAVIF